MRRFGIFVLIIGVLAVIGAMSMDVSVSTKMGRIINLGLMSDRQNFTMVAGLIVLSGLLMVIFGSKSAGTFSFHAEDDVRPCPKCAENIKGAAIRCRYCGADIEAIAKPRLMNGWVVSIPCKPDSEIDRLLEAIKDLGLPLVNMAEGAWGAGPFKSKNEARDALARLHENYKFYGDIVYRDSVSGKYPPVID